MAQTWVLKFDPLILIPFEKAFQGYHPTNGVKNRFPFRSFLTLKPPGGHLRGKKRKNSYVPQYMGQNRDFFRWILVGGCPGTLPMKKIS